MFELGLEAQPAVASFTHLVVNEVRAAPASFLASACLSQESFTHFVRKLVLAAPLSFLAVAWAEQESSAKARVAAQAKDKASAMSTSTFVLETVLPNLTVWHGPVRA